MTKSRKLMFAGVVSAAFLSASSLNADALFSVTVSSQDQGAPGSITVEASDFIDLIETTVNRTSDLEAFEDYYCNADITYLAVENAILLSYNPQGTELLLSIPMIDFQKDFTGLSSQSLEDQLEDFFKKEGADVYSRFIEQIAKTAPLAITDGNPNSSTAMMADNSFENYAVTNESSMFVSDSGSSSSAVSSSSKDSSSSAQSSSSSATRSPISFGIGFNSGNFKASGISGSNYNMSLSMSTGLTKNMSMVLSMPLNYTTVDDAKIYGVGLTMGLPYRIYRMSKQDRLSWKVTPFVGYSLRASVEMASGTAMMNYGLANGVDYRVTPTWVLGFANMLSFYKSNSISYEDYTFDSNVDQLIFKNGIRSCHKLGERWKAEAFILYTRFTKDAAVPEYWTFGGSLGYRITKSRYLTLGANIDDGDDFSSWSVGLSSAWSF